MKQKTLKNRQAKLDKGLQDYQRAVAAEIQVDKQRNSSPSNVLAAAGLGLIAGGIAGIASSIRTNFIGEANALVYSRPVPTIVNSGMTTYMLNVNLMNATTLDFTIRLSYMAKYNYGDAINSAPFFNESRVVTTAQIVGINTLNRIDIGAIQGIISTSLGALVDAGGRDYPFKATGTLASDSVKTMLAQTVMMTYIMTHQISSVSGMATFPLIMVSRGSQPLAHFGVAGATYKGLYTHTLGGSSANIVVTTYAMDHGPFNHGSWVQGTLTNHSYLGFKFINNAVSYYGWLALQVISGTMPFLSITHSSGSLGASIPTLRMTIMSIRLKYVEYETVTMADLKFGEGPAAVAPGAAPAELLTDMGDVGDLALLAAGASGLAALRKRRRQQARRAQAKA